MIKTKNHIGFVSGIVIVVAMSMVGSLTLNIRTKCRSIHTGKKNVYPLFINHVPSSPCLSSSSSLLLIALRLCARAPISAHTPFNFWPNNCGSSFFSTTIFFSFVLVIFFFRCFFCCFQTECINIPHIYFEYYFGCWRCSTHSWASGLCVQRDTRRNRMGKLFNNSHIPSEWMYTMKQRIRITYSDVNVTVFFYFICVLFVLNFVFFSSSFLSVVKWIKSKTFKWPLFFRSLLLLPLLGCSKMGAK